MREIAFFHPRPRASALPFPNRPASSR
jgi:hypothetical protein